jgi:branched-chain amino acid transport system permease protein
MPLTDFWRLLLGLAIIVLVLAFPHGIVGSMARLRAAFPARPDARNRVA